MSEREEFEKWWNEELGGVALEIEKKAALVGWNEAASRQQNEIDALKALNPDVTCPVCEGKRVIFNLRCGFCKDGRVPLTKAQEYQIKQLEELLQLHRENDKILGAME